MIQKLKTVLLTLAAIATVAIPVAAPVAVYAQTSQNDITQGLCAGSNLNTNQTQGCTVNSAQANDTINNILKTIINIFSLVVGVVSVIMIIIGGLRYITSGGESSNVSSAKNTILYAIVGLIIVALAQFIVHFVLGKVTGIS